ncbi:hypothetical protein [uncultured Bacteroides sp.]|uniref:hypothetical protein n=1 Tax=uncultured Bacteroides sp. TaxID=162156 RepID=UPI002608FFDA|nr:hypothetical protein [uncultured Bacteroides sp.]
METQTDKITLYAKRTFGEKVNAVFDFIRQNAKTLFKYLTYFMLPISILKALSVSSSLQTILSMGASETIDYSQVMTDFTWLILANNIGNIVLISLLFALIRIYNERENGLQGLTMNELLPRFLKNLKRTVIMILLFTMLFIFLIFFFVLLLTYNENVLFFIAIPLAFVMCIGLATFPVAYLLEDNPFFPTLVKTCRLGFRTWGGALAIIIVFGIITWILQKIASLPLGAVQISNNLLGENTEFLASSPNYIFITYLFSTIEAFGSYLASVLTFLGLAYQYGHSCEKIDNKSVDADIENFDNL